MADADQGTRDAVTADASPYRVLARKYRPTTFAELVGQDVLVRTLSNAIDKGRLAHAFVLTGVRGVGKTTTARILARALNCIGPEGDGGPTISPCGVCAQCVAIAEDRHVDILEMDAASRTGVNDIREVIDGVRYAPVSARYKIYIIDEVHMLSTQAFNALLKTLEEPPPHVKFIFATTEIRKIPVTVLSRCQRFDLRRLDTDTMTGFLGRIAEREGVAVEPAAIRLIARAAEGSARDGLSLLDQAIALAPGAVSEAEVSGMLGLADRGGVLDLLDHLFAGRIAEALATVRRFDAAGADPLVLVQDLLDLTHWLTRLKVVPGAAEDQGLPEAERVRGWAMADALSMAALARMWQMLLKGLGEARVAPVPLTAVEMLFVRIAYLADLPTPGDLVREACSATPTGSRPAPAAAPAPGAPAGAPAGRVAAVGRASPAPAPREAASPAAPEAAQAAGVAVKSFEALVALAEQRREPRLHAVLVNDVHLVRFEEGRLELRLEERVPADFVNRLGARLEAWTERRWVISVSQSPGAPTLREQHRAHNAALRDSIAGHPLVAATLKTFPDAQVREVRRLRPVVPPAGEAGLDGEPPEPDNDADAYAGDEGETE